MSSVDSLVYKYLLESGNTEAANALKKKNPSVEKQKVKKSLVTIVEQFNS
ncbi:hypothetical protein A0J61_09194, partial [Choanephora cucurbitarum]